MAEAKECKLKVQKSPPPFEKYLNNPAEVDKNDRITELYLSIKARFLCSLKGRGYRLMTWRTILAFCALLNLGALSSAQSPADSEIQLLQTIELLATGIESLDEQPAISNGSIVKNVM